MVSMSFSQSLCATGFGPSVYSLGNVFLWKEQDHGLVSGKYGYFQLTESEDSKPWHGTSKKVLGSTSKSGLVHLFCMNGGRAHYIIESKVQWKPFWLATQQYPENDWLGGNLPYKMTYAHGPHLGLVTFRPTLSFDGVFLVRYGSFYYFSLKKVYTPKRRRYHYCHLSRHPFMFEINYPETWGCVVKGCWPN